LQEDYSSLKAQWGGDTTYDIGSLARSNNATLNSVAAYYDLVRFQRLLDSKMKWRFATNFNADGDRNERGDGGVGPLLTWRANHGR